MVYRRPTQAEVARIAGTSTAVVSYVLNNGPRPVSAATRERVLAAIAQTGYRPNNVARALVSGKSSALGLIVPDLANPFLAQLAQCLEREFFEGGRCLLVGDSQDDTGREVAVVETMLRHQVDGLVWYSVDQPPPLDVIAAANIPVVILNATVEQRERTVGQGNEHLICVTTDERRHSTMATEHLITHGCRVIAHVGGPSGRLNSRERSRGWKDALANAHLQPGVHVTAPFTREGGFEAAATLARSGCDGVVVSNEMQAIGLLAGLTAAGVSVGEEIAVIALNGTENAEYTVPSLSAIHLDVERLASDIAKALIDSEHSSNIDAREERSEDTHADADVILTHVRLAERASCGGDNVM